MESSGLKLNYTSLQERIETAGDSGSKLAHEYLLDLINEYSELLTNKYSLEDSTNISNYDENFMHLIIKFSDADTIIKFLELVKGQFKADILRLLNERNRVGWTPIYYCPQHKNVELMRSLHSLDKNLIKHVSDNGSVLLKAAEVISAKDDGSTIPVLKFLIEEQKMNVNQADGEG